MTIGASDWTGQSLSGGRYQINAKLGEGGMGTVYRATDRNIDAEVVIKAPLRSMLADPEFARRFKDEIRSLVRLSHPHIVKLSDVGDWDGLPFAVMQYLPGGSLEDRKPAGPNGTFGAHDPREVGKWLGKVAEALDYVHSQGYVHRDVKPGNILFDGQGHPFLGDFGVVKVLTSDAGAKPSKTMTGAGMVVGTAEYMAPELIMGEPFDGKVDQYALAVTVFEILSGRRPFEDAATTKVLVLQTTKNPPRLDELRGWLPASVSDAVLKGLSKEPGERYATCLAFANAVTEAIAGAFEGQPERVRFLCGSCSRVLSLPPASHEKMVQTGKSVPCPGCQTPFQIPRGGEATTAGGVTRREGTLVEISLADPDEGPRRGTMIEPAAGFPLAQVPPIPGSPTLIEQPGLKRPAATLVEQPGLRRAPATMVEQPGLRSGLPGMPAIDTAPRESAPAPAPKPSPGLPIPLIAAGVAGVAVLAAVLLFTVGPMASKTPAPAVAQAPAAPVSETPRKSVASKPSPKPAAEESEETAEAALVATTASPEDLADKPVADLLAPKPGAPGLGNPGMLNASRVQTTVDLRRGLPQPPQGMPQPPGNLQPAASVAPAQPDAVETPAVAAIDLNKLRPVKDLVKLEDILKSPASYANQLLVLKRVYCVADLIFHRPDGRLILPIIESDLDLDFASARPSIRTRRGKAYQVEIEPKLAERFLRKNTIRESYDEPNLERNWGDNVGIFTVAVVPREGSTNSANKEYACTVVKTEFLIKIGPELVSINKNNRQRRVVYRTLTMTGDSETPGIGKAEDWAQMDRIFHIAKQFKSLMENQARQISDAKWSQFDNLLNNMISKTVDEVERNNRIPTPKASRIETYPGMLPRRYP